MRKKWVALIICGGAVAAIVWFLVGCVPNPVKFSDFATGIAIFVSAVLAIVTYAFSRKNQILALSEDKRDEFISSESFSRTRMLVEHNDLELQTVIMILNIAPRYEYDSDTLPRRLWILHEEFDRYLAFLEGLAILYNNGRMYRRSAEGLFSYSLERLEKVNTLDADTHAMKLPQIEKGMEGIYGGEIPERIERIWQEALVGNIERQARDPITGERINPLVKPIWFYINSPDKGFDSLISMFKKEAQAKVRFYHRLLDMIRPHPAK